eukprot:Amastigsp_a175805_49.p4 type:complete len:102 gc:universal Amastigsp_a175805_49:1405-1710(+)
MWISRSLAMCMPTSARSRCATTRSMTTAWSTSWRALPATTTKFLGWRTMASSSTAPGISSSRRGSRSERSPLGTAASRRTRHIFASVSTRTRQTKFTTSSI